MTTARGDRWHNPTAAAIAATGAKRLAEALGTSLTWIYRAANPTTQDALSWERAARADIEAAAAGGGTPHYDAMTKILADAGAFDRPGVHASGVVLVAAAREAIAALSKVLAPFDLQPAEAPS